MTENPTDPDFQIITIRPHELTPQEKEIRKVSDEATAEAVKRLSSSPTLKDWLTWQRAAGIYFRERNISWMWDYGGVIAEDLVEEQTNEKFSEHHAKDAKIAESLRPSLNKLPEKEGIVRVVLKRARIDNNYYTYRALAAFPSGVEAFDPSDGVVKDHPDAKGGTVYFRPENACTEHACDDLFKIHRDEPFYMPYRDLYDATKRLQTNKNGVNEYLLETLDEGTKVKQDAENYILVALLGGYSNENYIARVSDFWNKTSK